jgi:hypothetical protein
MANRNWNRAQNLEKEVKSIFARVTIGASGAPTLTKGPGFASIARDSAGLYTVTLQDQYNRLMHVSITQLEADLEDLAFQVTADNTTTSTKTFQFVCKAYDGDGAVAATDPSSGSILLIKVDLKNTTVGE